MLMGFNLRQTTGFDPYGIVTLIQNGDIATVKYLIDEHGFQRLCSYTLLCTALKSQHKEIAKLLISKGADVNPPTPTINSRKGCKRETPYTPLHCAVHVCDEAIMESLLQRGAALNAKAGRRNSTPLSEAVLYKKMDMIKVLLRHGADVNIPDGNRETPLQIAAERGVDITKLLLENGADPNSALHHAAKGGKLDVVKLLLSHGANIHSKSHNNTSPLHIAAEYRHGQLVEFLLKRGADVDAQDILQSHKSVLCTAVETGDPVIVNIVLSHGPSVKNKENKNAVFIALRNQKATKQGHVYGEIIENLLSYGFTIADEDANNPQVLFVAIRNGYVKTVKELLNRGSNLKVLRNSVLSDVLPLYPATLSQKAKLASILVKYGADENTRCTMGLRPWKGSILRNMDLDMFELLLTDKATVKNNPDLLKFAVWHGHTEIAECLLRHGINVNAQDTSGRTALHFCVLRRKNALCPILQRSRSSIKIDKGIIKLLLSFGAAINLCTTMGETPLHLAAQNNLTELVEILVNGGANVNAEDEQGMTALHYLAHNANFKMSEYILARGASVNAAGKNGATPLYVACKDGHLVMVQLLLEHGAEINLKSKTGTPLHIAYLEGHTNIVKFLIEYGADVNLINTSDNITPSDNAVRRLTTYRRLNSAVHADTKNFLLRHLVKMKAANLALNEKYLYYLKPYPEGEQPRHTLLMGLRNPSFVPLSYQQECEGEIAIMKGDKIEDSNISLYDVLVGTDERMVKLSANKSLAQVVLPVYLNSRYPNYASWIERRFLKGRWVKDLREECGQFLLSIAPHLPYLCIEQIIAYLSVSDLRLMAYARQRPT